MILQIDFSIYFSELYAEMQIDMNGYFFFIKLSLIDMGLIVFKDLKLFK